MVQRLRSREVSDEVAVAELEPFVDAATPGFLQNLECVVVDSPAAILRRKTRERVHHRVEVRADVEAPVLEVIARVHDGRERPPREHAIESVDEPRPAHASSQRDDGQHGLRCMGHAYKSSSGSRSKTAAESCDALK